MVGSKDLEPSNAPFYKIFINNQFCAKPQRPPLDTDLSPRTAIVSGGNTGLGYQTAIQLLDLKLSHLILAVRSPERGEAAAAKLRQKYPSAQIEVWKLDLSFYDSIQAFARRVETLSRIDIVILNAGVVRLNYTLVESTGHEENLQINYLSTVLLATLLLPTLKSKGPPDGTPARLTIVNAAVALAAEFPNRVSKPLLPSFKDPKIFNGEQNYTSSKLLVQMYLWKLVDYVSVDDVVVNLADPAWCKGTDLERDATGAMKVGIKVMSAIAARTKEIGASCFVDAAISKGKDSHGCFIMSWEIHP